MIHHRFLPYHLPSTLLGLLAVLPLLGHPGVATAQARGGAAADPVTRYTIAGEGNEARYRVREQLAGVSFPNDAVGTTSGITGVIVVDGTGRIQAAESQITVDVTTLKSDRDRRDGYVRARTLETATHPNVVLQPTELRGAKWPLPPSGTVTFQLIGNLTVRGVTRPTTWDVTLTVAGDILTGTATTSFTFDEFTITKPRVAAVLSVDDTIKLEYDLRLVRQPR